MEQEQISEYIRTRSALGQMGEQIELKEVIGLFTGCRDKTAQKKSFKRAAQERNTAGKTFRELYALAEAGAYKACSSLWPSQRGNYDRLIDQSCTVSRFSSKHLQPMSQGGENRFQIFLGGFGRAGEIYDESPTPDTRLGPGEHTPGSNLYREMPHGFRNSRCQPLAYGNGGLRRHVPRRETRAAGGNNEITGCSSQ